MQPKGLIASAYEPFCQARLSADAMRSVFAQKVEALRSQMDDWQLGSQPIPVQIALVDMAYNLGLAGLAKFVKLKAAVARGDWLTAADECARRGVQQPRNAATRELFLAAATEQSA
jgi:GH24 family phage-related lysozyme (muramidase)